MQKSVYIGTLGCAKNEVDSSNMAKCLIENGYVIVSDPQDADCLIVNTCSFIESATQESIDTIFDLTGRDGLKEKKIVVSGCMVSRYADALIEQMPEIDAFISCADENKVAEVVGSLIGKSNGIGAFSVESSSAPSAYVKISEGCDRACSFCTIPSIRGKYHSFGFEKIVEDVRCATESGAKEINLIAQDTGHWGRDCSDKTSLANLLEHLSDRFDDTYFRILYVQPDEVTDELLNVMAKKPNIIEYLDIPLQHVSKSILSAMNRTGSQQDFRNRAEHIRDILPNVTLRTTLMVGFPGESDEDFEAMLNFVSDELFDYIGVFSYSNEQGALSFDFENQIDEMEKRYRLEKLSDYCNAVAVSKVSKRVGSRTKVLVEDICEDGQVIGRALFQAPEVDGFVLLDNGQVGDMVDVELVEAIDYDLVGRVL